jgi:hypothetical protein
MKPGPDLEQARYPPAKADTSACRVGDAREDLEQGRFPRPVASNYADDVPLLYLK